jgi:tRNA-guanine family transglycosylase
MPVIGKKTALRFQIKAKCNLSKARSSLMGVIHYEVDTPVFMPVGTQVRMSIIKNMFVYFFV